MRYKRTYRSHETVDMGADFRVDRLGFFKGPIGILPIRHADVSEKKFNQTYITTEKVVLDVEQTGEIE